MGAWAGSFLEGVFHLSEIEFLRGAAFVWFFLGEVPGGWLQREEKKLVLARERKVRET